MLRKHIGFIFLILVLCYMPSTFSGFAQRVQKLKAAALGFRTIHEIPIVETNDGHLVHDENIVVRYTFNGHTVAVENVRPPPAYQHMSVKIENRAKRNLDYREKEVKVTYNDVVARVELPVWKWEATDPLFLKYRGDFIEYPNPPQN